jgi:transketolase
MKHSFEELEKHAKNLRRELFDFNPLHGLKHYGGSLSCIDILVGLFDESIEDDDKLILSKGHCAPPYYMLLQERGFNPTISGHPDIDPQNRVFCTTGSLGHGLGFGVGMALNRKILRTAGQIYVLMSEGEFQEGSTWETLMHARKYGLDNITAILDYNKIQSSDFVEKILPFGDLAANCRTFGWKVREVNGHSFPEIVPALTERTKGIPYLIIAHTIKGKGVSFMENSWYWHSESPTPEQIAQAKRELT